MLTGNVTLVTYCTGLAAVLSQLSEEVGVTLSNRLTITSILNTPTWSSKAELLF